jgi:dihydrofolate reductase
MVSRRHDVAATFEEERMRKVMVLNNLTLDGVMQAPGRPDEDHRGGFEHGGWATPYDDAVKGQAMGEGMSQRPALLFGRRTYEDFYKVWPGRTDNPFTAVLDGAQKYVASRTLRAPLPWINSTLLDGDAADAVDRLRREPGPDLLVMGSGVLVESLVRRDLVDRFMLLIHPLVLGTGRCLFTHDGTVARLRLVKCVPTTTGVIMVTYEPADRAARESE